MADASTATVNGVHEEAQRLAATLSLEEQVSLLAGKDFWRTVAIPEKGIPPIKLSDGPNGARGGLWTDGTPAALFPCGVSLAATWNLALLHEVGQHLAAETQARSAHALLGPTVCLHRSPLGGRNFEAFSEDPYLTGKIAAAYITGLQSRGVAATIKHFVCNEQEKDRINMDCQVAERPLRELYLKAFEIAIRDAKPWALMTAYNLVNGVHADMNTHTVRDILRGEWKFDGMVMSDWTGTNSVVESIAAGCDLEMPGPAKWRGTRAVQAVKDGQLKAEDVEKCATNVLRLVERTNSAKTFDEAPERTDDTPERRALLRRVAHEGITLLKNDDVLPLQNGTQTIAVIGPNAARAVANGGGSAALNPYYTTSPLQGLQETFKGKILYAQGCDTRKWLRLLSDTPCTAISGNPGLTIQFYKGEGFESGPLHTGEWATSDLKFLDNVPEAVLPAYAFTAQTKLTPKTSGNHTFSFMSIGPGRLYVNGSLLVDNWNWTEKGETMFGGSVDVLQTIHLEAGKPVDVRVESNNRYVSQSTEVTGPRFGFGGCRIGFQEEQTDTLLGEAVNAARAADVAIVCVGLDGEWESEGYDRHSMDLPRDGSQDTLIRAVVTANPRTVVVNQSGTPVSMPWADDVPAIVQAWYQGCEAGRALADVLLGVAAPTGKLPVTFPVHERDNPAYHNWPGENRQVTYGEGLFIGYRHYDRVAVAPRFAFGHGLTYTRFQYGTARSAGSLSAVRGSAVRIRVPVRNIGTRAGAETVQVYVRHGPGPMVHPEKALQGFAKVELAPGEEREVELVLDRYAVGYYNTLRKRWVADKGTVEALVGASSRDIRTQFKFEVAETFSWIFDEYDGSDGVPPTTKAQL